MSNPVRYDSLLVRYLGRELEARLVGRACRSMPHRESEHSAALSIVGAPGLRFDLHPSRGWILPLAESEPDGADAEILAVTVPADERLLTIAMRGGSRFRPQRRSLIVELHGNQWNLLLLDEEERILFVLRPRLGGNRILRTGEAYRPPPPRERLSPATGSRETLERSWCTLLGPAAPEERARLVQQSFAYTGAVSASAFANIALSGWENDLRAAFDAWWRLASLPPAEPVVLELSRGPQPYPFPLPGLPATAVDDLLSAMRIAADAQAPVAVEAAAPGVAAAARTRQAAAERKARRLRERLAEVGRAERARCNGDLLLAHLAAVPRGADHVALTDWDGSEVVIRLQPELSPAANADRWYAEARRLERAEAALPALIREAEAEAERWAAIATSAEEGRLDANTGERIAAGAARSAVRDAPRLPYRIYRTSGGLEVRVGRGSADNDRLTFGHARPEDIWLHARDVAGSHVVLRWPNAEQAPPARDLEEAAGLAAWFSKARTSGVVAVDWTRRKHVRKPRGAPPGRVSIQRVKTVFVEPDPAFEDRLAVPGPPDTIEPRSPGR